MKTLIKRQTLVFSLLANLFFLTSCSLFPQATQEPEYILGYVTEQDIEHAVSFGGDILDGKEWSPKMTVTENRVMVTWENEHDATVIFLDYRIYSDGYTQADLDLYYSDDNFEEIMLSLYQDLKSIAQCANSDGSLMLYEFVAQFNEENYTIRNWVKLESETRISDAVLIFPTNSFAELERYSDALFPFLSSCVE